MEEQLEKILEKAIIVAEKSGEFAINQAPLLLKEFYYWHVVSSIMGILLGVILFVASFALLKALGSKDKESLSDYEDGGFFLGMYYSFGGALTAVFTSGILLISGIVVLCGNTYDLVYISVAPKLYLIDYFINIKH